MSLQVRRGREDRKPFRTAFIRVDVEGEQRERTTYKTYEASEMLLMMGEDLVVRPARHMSRGKGRGGGGRLRVHKVSLILLEPVR